MEHLAITSFEVGLHDNMDSIEEFFILLEGRIQKRKPNSISVWVNHPDGMEVYIKVKCYEFEKKYMEVLRRNGDTMLFHLVYKMIINYDFGRGDVPNLSAGQLCPKIEMKPADSPRAVPFLHLDVDLKRKRS